MPAKISSILETVLASLPATVPLQRTLLARHPSAPPANPHQRLERLLVPPDLCQPPGALPRQQHAQPQKPTRNQLQAHGDAPLHRSRLHVLLDGVVDPVAGKHAQGEEELEHGAELAADLLGGHFARVHGDDDGGDADAQAGNGASRVPAPDGVVGEEELQDGADVEDEGGEDDGVAATEAGGEGPDEEAGEEGCFASC